MNAILFIPFLIASTETLYLARIRDTLKKSFGCELEYFNISSSVRKISSGFP
jgi:hypothetical protein